MPPEGSRSSRGNSYDSAVVESFFSTLEFELLPAAGMGHPRGHPRGRGPILRGVVQSPAAAWSPAELEALLAHMALQLTGFAGC